MIYKQILTYCSFGVLNTSLYLIVFFISYNNNFSQSISNFLGFVIAVTFSFFVNARFTFKSKTTLKKYILYVLFLGGASLLLGKISDIYQLRPLYTIVGFSVLATSTGFIFARFVVFKDTL